MKNKLAMFDLDGTLCKTIDVNYYSYKMALEEQGFELEYNYFCRECNGRHYTTFIPEIIGEKKECLEVIHKRKKELYYTFLSNAILNQSLIDLANGIKDTYFLAIVTTASRQNTEEILKYFKIMDMFELVITQEDISNPKPNPEGFLRAMEYFEIDCKNSIIFEDSDVGIQAAIESGSVVYKIEKF